METQIAMTDLAAHTSALVRGVRASGEGLLVTRRYRKLVVAILPARDVLHDVQIPIRQLSRETYSVIEQVVQTGEPATITNRGTAVAEITPITPEEERQYAADIAAQSDAFMSSLRRADQDLEGGRAITLDDSLLQSLPENA